MGCLDGKVVIVTGGGRGLGRAFAEAICREGGKVVVAELVEELGHQAVKELALAGHEVLFVQTDTADWLSVRNMAETVVENWGGIDGLVNNAALATGIGGKNFEDIPVEEWDRVIAVNVRGPWLSSKAVIPYLRIGGGGKIVNIASDTFLWGAPVLMHYVASKGAVIAMTRAMAQEVGADNVSVNAIAPGLTKVEATESVAASRHEFYVNGRAFRREQYPEDVTGAIVFLLSDASDFVTGQLLAVNGGFAFH